MESRSIPTLITPVKARQMLTAYKQHISDRLSQTFDPDERKRLRDGFELDQQQHAFRVLGKIAYTSSANEPVDPMTIMRQLVEEDGASNEPDRAEHDRASLVGIMAICEEAILRYEIPPSQYFIKV